MKQFSNAGGEKGCAGVYLCGGGLLTSWLTCWFVDIVLAINNGQPAAPPQHHHLARHSYEKKITSEKFIIRVFVMLGYEK